MTAKEDVLALDSGATCRIERSEPTAGLWVIVRDGDGGIIGRHRTIKVAWEVALRTLRKRDRPSITDPAKMTADDRHDYIDAFPCVEELRTCVHGHDGCSISRGGPCLDDVLRYMEAHGEMK